MDENGNGAIKNFLSSDITKEHISWMLFFAKYFGMAVAPIFIIDLIENEHEKIKKLHKTEIIKYESRKKVNNITQGGIYDFSEEGLKVIRLEDGEKLDYYAACKQIPNFGNLGELCDFTEGNVTKVYFILNSNKKNPSDK